MIKFQNKKTEVLQSEGKGLGVFAKRNISEGELIECSPVVILPDEEWRLVEETILGDYVFETEEDQVCLALGTASLYNHSFDPNAVFDPHNEFIKILASRDIVKGEEIYVDYNWEPFHYFENNIVNKEKYFQLEAEQEEDEDEP